MAVEATKIQHLLEKAFPNSEITITDLVGDNNHYSVTVTSQLFTGKSRVMQHKLVNEALKELLAEELHALQVKTIVK